MKVSIIITYYLGANVLRTCLKKLFESIQACSTEIEIIVINDNPDEKVSKIILDYSRIQYITHETNKGHAAACNTGANIAKGDVLIFMDCDIFVTSDWLQKLLDVYALVSDIGAISSLILDSATGKIHTAGIEIHQMDILKILRGNTPDVLTTMYSEYNFLPSACLLIPKKVFQEVNGFDEHFFNSDGDLDLTFKIKQKGYKLLTAHQSTVFHKGRIAGAMRNLFINDTKALFFQKWGFAFPDGIFKIQDFYSEFSSKNSLGKEYILLNFSKSLNSSGYIECLEKNLNTSFVQILNFKQYNNSQGISMVDFFNYNLVHYQVPFLFLSENYLSIKPNYFWFLDRKQFNDISADINGNICFARDLI